MSKHGHTIAMNLTGSGVVYPGHPLVLATIIMEIYGSFDEANTPTGHGWCEALADHRIPGAGDHVGAAMRTLAIGAKGGTADEMIAYANRYWSEGSAGGHLKNVDAGLQQAEVFVVRFRDLAGAWASRSQTVLLSCIGEKDYS